MTLIPWPYQAATVAAMIVAVFGFGYLKGLHHQSEIDDAKFAQIRATQDEEAIHAGRVALDRSVAVGSIVDTYEAQRRNLDAYYAGRLRAATAGHSPVAVPGNPLPAGTDARSADLGPDPAYVELQSRCAETTLMLIDLQKAARAYEEIK